MGVSAVVVGMNDTRCFGYEPAKHWTTVLVSFRFMMNRKAVELQTISLVLIKVPSLQERSVETSSLELLKSHSIVAFAHLSTVLKPNRRGHEIAMLLFTHEYIFPSNWMWVCLISVSLQYIKGLLAGTLSGSREVKPKAVAAPMKNYFNKTEIKIIRKFSHL